MKKLLIAILFSLSLFANESFMLGLKYYYDKNDTTNNKAINLLIESANNSNADAAFLLGVAYDKGTLVEENKEEALKWYQKAASLDDIDSMVLSGWFYYQGKGCEKNIDEAKFWFEKAALLGDDEAKDMLVLIAENEGSFF